MPNPWLKSTAAVFLSLMCNLQEHVLSESLESSDHFGTKMLKFGAILLFCVLDKAR